MTLIFNSVNPRVKCTLFPALYVIIDDEQRICYVHRQRPYHVECTASRPISEVKQRWAWLVLGWVTAWEHQVLLAFVYFFSYRSISMPPEGMREEEIVDTSFKLNAREIVLLLSRAL